MKANETRCFAFFLCAAIVLIGFDTEARSSRDPGGHTNRGVRYAREKQYDKAIAEFTKAIEAEPSDPKNYANRAFVYKASGKPDQAIKDFAKVIELRPKDADAYSNKGLLEVEQRKFDAAIKDLTRAVELTPKDVKVRRYRAYAFLQTGQWKMRLKIIRKLSTRRAMT